jgi:hypothetical protein
MKFSDQAAAALLMCLQKCIAEETDIMPLKIHHTLKWQLNKILW